MIVGKKSKFKISISGSIKKIIICLCILSLIFYFIASFLNVNSIFAESKVQYAKVVSSNVKLYRSLSGNEDFLNVYFTIPQSYFLILNYCDNDNYYSATYLDITGYVKRNEVQCVKGTPSTPFANDASFRVWVPGGIELRSSPTQSQGLNTVATIQPMETNLKYYGSIDGEESISYKSTNWYYCKYYKNGISQSGYVYAAFCDLLTLIPENKETLEYIDSPDFEETIPTSSDLGVNTELSSLPSVTQIIIIVAVCLPCIFLIYLLFRPTKITAKVMEEVNLNSKKSKKKKNKHRDYYEYDE